MKKDTKIKIYALAAIALIAAIAGSYDLWARSNMVPVFPEERSAQEAQMQDSAAAGKFDKAPDFSFTTRDGTALSLFGLEEPVILLHFWASWCAPCVAEFPDLYKLVAQHKGRIALLAVSLDSKPDDIENFLGRLVKEGKWQTGAPHIYIVRDEKSALSRDLFGVVRVPETVFIGPQRMMRDKKAGEIDWLGPDIENLIAGIL